MPHLVTASNQDALKAWAAPRLQLDPSELAADSEAVGVLDKATGEILAVILYNAHYGHFLSMHVTTNGGKRWLSKFTLRLIFGYAFHHKKVKRINAVVSVKNIPIQILCLKLGFRIETTIRCGATDGGDGILFGMLVDECRWLEAKRTDDGQEKRT
jgi:RimJ/RimL family protein N-acetyltransferase